jgi:hypothetical protein
MKTLLLFFLLNNAKPKADTVAAIKPKYFIAMQYIGLSNCILKVFVTDTTIMLAKVNGYITISPSFGLGTAVPKNVMHDPEAYVNKKMDSKFTPDLLANRQQFLKNSRLNYIIAKKDIRSIYHNPEKKWGMAYYPHNGRIMIVYKKSSLIPTELILVGDQNADDVLRLLKL